MAQTYEQWKKSYESLDDAQKKLYADTISSKGADYIGNKYLSQYNAANTPSTPKNNTVTETYRGQVSDGTSNMNSMSQTAAQSNSRNFQVGTGDVAEMPEQPKVSSVQQPAQDNFAQSWNSLSAAQQQAALTKKGMLDYVNSKGLTVKKEETPVTTTTKPKQTTYTTPKQQEWDYQDNSQARMDEIARNLNGFRQTNPELFQDPSTFYGFFIDGKGRSQDQIDYLWNYYDRVKKYSKYDNMPASALGEGLADGTIPQDYLDYIKGVDPQKYQEILSYKQDGEDRIKNESYLEDLTSMAGYESEESNLPEASDPVTYAKKMGYFVDEDGNWVDDNLYVKPTDEERQDVDRINEINARRMEIKNMQKNLLDDLTEQYPGVPKATLMGIVQDRTKDISREYDDLGVELVQLQGTVDYLQNERSMQAEARQQTIKNLDTAYGMYYQYSPEGIAELAQSQYAATNITLDQADQGNETQKQMALQNVLDGYYEKYGDIIQRSEQQVINDVIAYAKKNGVGLAEALQENFVKPLQQKPGFTALSGDVTGLSWEKVGKSSNGDDIYGFVDLVNRTVTPYGTMGTTTTTTGTRTYTTEEVSSNRDKRVAAMYDIANQYTNLGDMAEAISYNMEGVGDGKLECGVYVNDYINAVTGTKGGYGNSIESKKALATNKNWDDIQVGDAIVFDYNINTPQWVLNSPQKEELLKYGHVGFVTGVNPDGSINMSHTNGGVVRNIVVEPGSSFYNSFAGSQHIKPSSNIGKGFNEQWTNEYVAFINAAGNPSNQAKIAEGLGLTVDEMREQSNKYSWSQTADTYFDVLNRINGLISDIDTGKIPSFLARKNALNDKRYGGVSTVSKDVSDWYANNSRIVSVLGLDSLINLKGRGATFGALSDSEREAINDYATSLGNPMSDALYKQELIRLRDKLIESSHGYLGDLTSQGQNQSYYDWMAGI